MSSNAPHSASDMAQNGWIDTRAPAVIRPYLHLMRVDRPIGTWLLFFPCLWAATMAADGLPDPRHVFLFLFGSWIMRGAGCVMNDLADRNFDGQVARTATRPIPSGAVSAKQAALFMGGLCLIGLLVLVQFNTYTIYLGIASLGLVFIYPFCKRWTYWPQVILGLTFNWGALVGWSASQGALAAPAVALYIAGLFWTLGYDTVYAHQDKDDDVMIGIKSSALRLGDKTVPFLWVFYGLTIGLITWAGYESGLSVWFYTAMVLPAVHFLWQIFKVDIHQPKNCLIIFKANKWVGWLISLAILAGKFPL